MGLAIGIGKKLFGGSGRAERAARQAADVQRQAYERIEGLNRPIYDFGMSFMPQVGADATAAGMGASIDDIMSGNGFGSLIAERQRASQNALASAGLRRSGAAATEAARIPADMAFQLEQELARRRQSNLGYGMAGLQGMSGAIEGAAQAQASGILGAQQARQQRYAGIGSLLGMAGGAMIGGPAGASAGASLGGSLGGFLGG